MSRVVQRRFPAFADEQHLRRSRKCLEAALFAVVISACVPLQKPEVAEPKPAEPLAKEPPIEIEPPVVIEPPRDPMAVVHTDKPLSGVKGTLEQIDCLNGSETLHARMALEARGGQVTSFAYYSRWQFYTCSISLDQRDPRVRWRKTADGSTRVQTPQGSFVIHVEPKAYVFEFQNVQRGKYCGMRGQINGTMRIERNVSPPICSVAGILER